jgi:multidrug resistance efflux pump
MTERKLELADIFRRLDASFLDSLPAAQALVQGRMIPLQDTALKAPLNGLVLQKSVEKGTLVSPGKIGFVVADTSSVKAAFGVADIAVPEMKLGSKLTVETEIMPGAEP